MTEGRNGFSFALGEREAAIRDALARLEDLQAVPRLWAKDASLWKSDPQHQQVIQNSLGWLTVPRTMLDRLPGVEDFVAGVRAAEFQHAVVLGMGGSSLCPEVCRATFATAPGYLKLHILDSTVPGSVAAVERAIDVGRALFLVSSKSGGTAETLSFYKYFSERVRSLKGERAGENFVAITDPGTSLEKLAREARFRAVFHGEADIGGRYSALSNFGLVPAALAGVDVRGLLERAGRMAAACAPSQPAPKNPGLVLGGILGAAGRAGRDKITFVMSPGIYTFGDWVEQLLAESTGKEGKGLLPVVREHLDRPATYGPDRLFVDLRLASEPNKGVEQKLEALERAGHPVVRIKLESKLDLGGEFFRWEVATAMAGVLLGINPFDQPNVQESKDHTNRLLAEYRAQGKFSGEAPLVAAEGVELYASAAVAGPWAKAGKAGGGPVAAELLAAFFAHAQAGSYVALLAYLEPTSSHKAVLQAIRMRVRDALGVATTLGYGPRYLHSTGQFHKGGAAYGLFLLVTADDAEDLPVPGEAFSFSVLKQAQALGDFQSLASRGRPVVRFHLGKTSRTGLDDLLNAVDGGLRRLAEARRRS
jgi:glucose-6-phosphate isomerase